METPNLSQHFSPEEINILSSIVVRQIPMELHDRPNPYADGMCAFLEKNLDHPDTEFRERALEITRRFDEAEDSERTLQRELIQKVITDSGGFVGY